MRNSVLSFLRSRKFAIAAFLIPLGVRSIPEILVGPYQVGWDTIAFYVPNTLDWAAGRASFTTILGTAPLMYAVSVGIYLLTRVNPVWIFKFMGPMLYGTLIFALFRFLRLGLKWPDSRSLGAALLTSLYFVTLRISWDMYRNMLGLTFILLSLPLFYDWKNPRNQVLLSILTILSVASDPLTGVISLVLIGGRVLVAIAKMNWNEFSAMIKIGLPGAALFSSITYAGLIAPGIGVTRPQAPVPTLASLWTSLGFLGFAYLALTPLIPLGLMRVANSELRNWSIFCIVTASLALLPMFGPVVQSYRWSLLLDIPLCVYGAAGLARLTSFGSSSFGWVRVIQRQIVPIGSAVLIISAMLYIALPAQQAMYYYTAFPGLLPTSMVQDTVPMSDLANLRALLDSAANSMGSGTTLIAHQAIYGWARAYLPNLQDRVIDYQYNSPLTGVSMAQSLGYSSIFMIWWVDGTGWHGQTNVPVGFSVVQTIGDMALYKYQ